ncbi:hypothetical protein LCGC14_1510210 [marine sediment metagenome]|uniref:Uncharacterized protein n=1 Tax=marine sediment metagenome TaxID=412755 RepID=A0A0F9LH04_9ZZZZ
MAEAKEVVLTKDAFNKKDIYELRTQVVKVPELNALMNLPPEQTATMIVQQLDLGGVLESRGERDDLVKNMIDGIVAASTKATEVEKEVKKVLKKESPDVQHRMSIISRGLKDPKLNDSDILFLVKKFPTTARKLVDVILMLTDKGADLKKNSTG